MAINVNELSNVNTYRQSAAKVDARSQQPQEKAVADDKPVVDSVSSRELLKQVENHPQMVRRNLAFSIDEETGREVIRVIDSETKEVIRQLPPEQILHMIAQIQELRESMTPGVLLDDKV
jgi:flagellar protein FlaG